MRKPNRQNLQPEIAKVEQLENRLVLDAQGIHFAVRGLMTADTITLSGEHGSVQEQFGDLPERTWPITATIHIQGAGGDDVIDASQLNGFSDNITLSGGSGNDTIIGTPGDDVIYGGRGDDRIIGNGGDDTIIPGQGNDTIITMPENAFPVAKLDTAQPDLPLSLQQQEQQALAVQQALDTLFSIPLQDDDEHIVESENEENNPETSPSDAHQEAEELLQSQP